MSAFRHVTIICDAENCGYWEDAGVADDAETARRQLMGGPGPRWRLAVPARDGSRRREDFCPKHSQVTP